MFVSQLKIEKDNMRSHYSSLRDSIDIDERKRRDKFICEAIKSSISFRHSNIILFYSAIKSEIDLSELMDYCFENNKRVALPKCNVDDHTMKFHYIEKKSDLSTGAYGILEPSEDSPIFDPATEIQSSLCLIPGLTFDVYGYRLGYGKGYYDKFLRTYNGCKMGITYTELISRMLPKSKFDVHCDIIMTEKGLKSIKK